MVYLVPDRRTLAEVFGMPDQRPASPTTQLAQAAVR
jgi:hypothetical protein